MKTVIKLLFLILPLVYSRADTSDEKAALETLIEKKEFDYEKLKRQNVVFNFGTNLSTRNSFLLGEDGKYFASGGKYPFELSPNNMWSSINTAFVWGSMVFDEGNFVKLGVDGTFLIGYESVLPVFNVAELFIAWKYPLGRIHIGRKVFSLNSLQNFAGTLDGIGIEINAPVINFKSFIGFSGFTGVFHPWYNNFNITAYDKSFSEKTNLTNLVMVVQLNGKQSRRIFLSTDFDVNYYFFNINPYFLMQLDISNIDVPNFKNNDYTINTFTIGLLTKVRIWSPLYFHFDLAGVFGAMQDLVNGTSVPISSFGINTELRYTFSPSGKSAISLLYAAGSGSPGEKNKGNELRTSTDKIGRYIYYGKFNGGFVLDPVLYNIHSIGAKFTSNILDRASFYAHFYQTLKMYPESPISDEKAVNSSYLVGSEIDLGLNISFTESVKLSLDAGLFIPLAAYSDKTVRFKTGLMFVINL